MTWVCMGCKQSTRRRLRRLTFDPARRYGWCETCKREQTWRREEAAMITKSPLRGITNWGGNIAAELASGMTRNEQHVRVAAAEMAEALRSCSTDCRCRCHA